MIKMIWNVSDLIVLCSMTKKTYYLNIYFKTTFFLLSKQKPSCEIIQYKKFEKYINLINN